MTTDAQYDMQPCGCFVDEDSRLHYCPLHAAAVGLRESLTLLVASTTAAIECGVLALDPNDESDSDWGARLSQARALLARLGG